MKIIKKIAIITTRQNYKWTSMQEVLPGIEKCWQIACERQDIIYQVINVDIDSFRAYFKYIVDVDLFVIIAFNEVISRFMKIIRTTFNPNAPFVLHLYGHATIGLWPQYRFGVLTLMRSNDIFIGTCNGDKRCMDIIIKNAKTEIIPYPYFEESIASDGTDKVFAYVGRISDQKNLDILLKAYSILLNKNINVPRLFIYGEEDGLGHPNMGIPSTSCLVNLKKLVTELKLSDYVVFKGFKNRDEIYSELSREHVFVTASTHSDENFGMALMRSLAMGACAVVTNWGGHSEFYKYVSDRVFLVPVMFQNNRPLPMINLFADKMEEVLPFVNANYKIPIKKLPSYFLPSSVSGQFQVILNEVEELGDSLECSDFAKNIYLSQAKYEKLGYIQRAFEGYEDINAQQLLSAYVGN